VHDVYSLGKFEDTKSHEVTHLGPVVRKVDKSLSG
jgi:hypothetical protein